MVVTRPDKGVGVVLLDKAKYVEKMLNILSDTSKFRKLKDDLFTIILRYEDKLNRLLRKLKNCGSISESIYSTLFASGSKPGIMYGLPKVHKDDCPLRPVLSAIGTFNYSLAKFLVPILSPITSNEFTVSNSFQFAKEICNLNIKNCFMASFDITSLFTNIPLQETIDICLTQLFRTTSLVEGLNKSQIKEMLKLSLENTIFLLNGDTYQQIDGVSMGSPLSPSAASIFLCYHEQNWLRNCPSEFKPILYKRYVDDTFVVFKSKDHAPKFLDYLNSQHANIKFTSENEVNGSLPFLDIFITKTETGFETSLFRKKTFTGLCTKFSSFIPLSYKRNLISTLTYRAYNICSTYFSLDKELRFIRDLMFNNGFPKSFTDTYIGKTLSKIMTPYKPVLSVPRDIVYFQLTFTGQNSINLKKRLTKLLREFYPQLNIRVIFSAKQTLQNFFKFKDTIPLYLQSSIVYKYTCNSCNAMYIGKTKRHLKSRIFEHLGKSVRTNQWMTKPPFSAIRDHAQQNDHPIRNDSFSVLGSARSDQELLIMESLHQVTVKPTIGGNEVSTPLLCF